MPASELSFFARACARAARQPPMSEADERALAERWIASRDRAAGEALIEAHLPIVQQMAHRLRGYGVPQDELVGEGNIGLLRALEKFDLRGVRFKTYATYWVRAQMLAYAMRSKSIVTSATGALGARFFFKLRGARAKAEALLGPGHDGIDALLAKQFGVTEEQVRDHSARLGLGDVSLDAPVGEEGDPTSVDLMPSGDASPETTVAAAQRDEMVHQTVRRVWKGLDVRERAVLSSRLMNDEDDTTLAELGDRFQLSRERLRQIEMRVKDRLKRALDTAGAAAMVH